MMQLSSTISEKMFQELLIDAARIFGWLAYHSFDSRRSAQGFPDLVLVRPPEVLFVELKSTTGKVTDLQQLWLDQLVRCDEVNTFVWRPQDWAEIEARLRR